MGPSIVYPLIGYPGVGKHTVASAMVDQADELHERLVLVDNHYINNPIFGLMDLDGIRPVPVEAWVQVRKVRDAVFTTIRELSPPGWSFIKTNYLADEPSEQRSFEEVADLAKARSAEFLPVILRCQFEEHLVRLVDPRRAERLKWRDREGLRRLMEEKGLLEPLHPNLMDLDVTGLAPRDAAGLILARGQSLLSGGV